MSDINQLVMENMGSYRSSINSGNHGQVYDVNKAIIPHNMKDQFNKIVNSGSVNQLHDHKNMTDNHGSGMTALAGSALRHNAPAHSGMGAVRGAVGETHSGNIVQGISNLINKFRN